jgi:hypothetical protein
MTEPPRQLRCTDPEVADLARALIEHGEGSLEYVAALRRCTQRLADWIDDQAARAVYDELAKAQATLADDPK